MPNTSIPADGGAMSATMETPQSIYLLLASYWRSMHDLTVAMKRTDAAESDTPEYDAAFAAQGVVGEHVTEMEVAIAAFIPANRYDARLKAAFLEHLAAGNHGRLEEDVTAALLSSLPCLVEWRASA
jgi:hypothetical protein